MYSFWSRTLFVVGRYVGRLHRGTDNLVLALRHIAIPYRWFGYGLKQLRWAVSTVIREVWYERPYYYVILARGIKRHNRLLRHSLHRRFPGLCRIVTSIYAIVQTALLRLWKVAVELYSLGLVHLVCLFECGCMLIEVIDCYFTVDAALLPALAQLSLTIALRLGLLLVNRFWAVLTNYRDRYSVPAVNFLAAVCPVWAMFVSVGSVLRQLRRFRVTCSVLGATAFLYLTFHTSVFSVTLMIAICTTMALAAVSLELIRLSQCRKSGSIWVVYRLIWFTELNWCAAVSVTNFLLTGRVKPVVIMPATKKVEVAIIDRLGNVVCRQVSPRVRLNYFRYHNRPRGFPVDCQIQVPRVLAPSQTVVSIVEHQFGVVQRIVDNLPERSPAQELEAAIKVLDEFEVLVKKKDRLGLWLAYNKHSQLFMKLRYVPVKGHLLSRQQQRLIDLATQVKGLAKPGTCRLWFTATFYSVGVDEDAKANVGEQVRSAEGLGVILAYNYAVGEVELIAPASNDFTVSSGVDFRGLKVDSADWLRRYRGYQVKTVGNHTVASTVKDAEKSVGATVSVLVGPTKSSASNFLKSDPEVQFPTAKNDILVGLSSLAKNQPALAATELAKQDDLVEKFGGVKAIMDRTPAPISKQPVYAVTPKPAMMVVAIAPKNPPKDA